MAYLTREAILAVDDRPVVEVEVPEWGGTVRVQALDALSGQQLANDLANGTDEGLRIGLAARTMVDEQGVRLFSDADVYALAAKSWDAILRVSDAAIELARVRKGEAAAAAENFD